MSSVNLSKDEQKKNRHKNCSKFNDNNKQKINIKVTYIKFVPRAKPSAKQINGIDFFSSFQMKKNNESKKYLTFYVTCRRAAMIRKYDK